MKVGVFTVGLPDLTPEEAVAELADAGYEGIEWRVAHVPEELRNEEPSFWGNNLCTLEPTEDDARRAAKLVGDAGLETVGLGTYIGVGDLGSTEDAMRFAQTAGSPQIRVGVSRPDGQRSVEEMLGESRAYLEEVEGIAGRYGVKALVEIHHGTLCPSASLTHRLLDGLDPERIGAIFDPGNMAHEGFEDYGMGLDLLGPYLAHVHLKNTAYDRPEGGGVWKGRWAPLEDGVVDFGQLFEGLERVGYDGWLVIEDFSAARPTREALRHNLDFVRAFIDGTT